MGAALKLVSGNVVFRRRAIICCAYTLDRLCWCRVAEGSAKALLRRTTEPISRLYIVKVNHTMFARPPQLSARVSAARHPCALLACTTARTCVVEASHAQRKAVMATSRFHWAVAEQQVAAGSAAAAWAVPVLAVRSTGQHCRGSTP